MKPSGGSQPGKTEKPGPVKSSAQPQPNLKTKPIANGEEKVTASGRVSERVEKKSDGTHHQYISPTGRPKREEVERPNGARETVHYAPNGKVQRTEVVHKDGARETTQVHYGRDGKERATETIKVDRGGHAVSKTVVVRQNTLIVRNSTIVRERTIVYDHARFGYVYHPYYVVGAPVFASWYDPYWYSPVGLFIPHPFHFSWGWDGCGWYGWGRGYWSVYDVYPAPSYWMTDWMIAGYVADRYAATVSLEQAREDARLARLDAEKAHAAAERAKEDAELAEAQAAENEAKARLARAEALAAKAELEESRAKSRASQPNPNATPIDPETKESLRHQIEQTVAEEKEFAEKTKQGANPVVADLSKALADPKHIYPVSSTISVILADGQNPAGSLSEGDLLRLEPGQEAILKDATENTMVIMRVLTSKGEEGEVRAGTLISVSLRNLQDFDSEFRAKLDLGLAEADKNQGQFKSGAL